MQYKYSDFRGYINVAKVNFSLTAGTARSLSFCVGQYDECENCVKENIPHLSYIFKVTLRFAAYNKITERKTNIKPDAKNKIKTAYRRFLERK